MHWRRLFLVVYLIHNLCVYLGGSMILIDDSFWVEEGQSFGRSKCTKISAVGQMCSLWENFVQDGRITQV